MVSIKRTPILTERITNKANPYEISEIVDANIHAEASNFGPIFDNKRRQQEKRANFYGPQSSGSSMLVCT